MRKLSDLFVSTHQKSLLLFISLILLTLNAIILGGVYYFKTQNELHNTSEQSSPSFQVSSNDKSSQVITQEVKALLKSKGGKPAWEYLKEQAKSKNILGVHDLAHLVGSTLFIEKGLDSLNACDTSFAFGCYHGALEEYIAEKGVDSLPEVVTYCQKYHTEVALTCYHGIGHGLLSYYKYDLPPALTDCDGLLEPNLRSYCYRGVFMEAINVALPKISQSDPLWPCTTVSDEYKRACYNYQMVYLTRLFGSDIHAIEKACEKAESSEFARECIKGLGRQWGQQFQENPQEIVAHCQKMTDKAATECIIAASEEMVFQGSSSKDVIQHVCSELKDPARNICSDRATFQESLRTSTLR